MNRLAGVSREKWLDKKLWLQIRAALQGRRTYVADSAGLALVVAREPGTHELQKLPKVVRLTRERLTPAPYAVTLGIDRRGPVILDVAREHRAILMGGATGSGKTNAVQAILAQLAMKHGADAVQFAIVDTKEVDFTGWHGLPHLFQHVAHNLDAATALIENVEAERRRRKAVMVKAGVKDWRRLPEPLPLLVLVVDEAADFEGTEAMETLTEVARKGRAFGVSVIVGTQYPTSRVIDPQVKANLPTAIALRCRTGTESRVILDRNGAEDLDRPGLAMSYISGQWRRVQSLLFDQSVIEELSDPVTEPEQTQALGEVEAALVRYALEELDGAFTVGKLYEAHKDDISRRQVVNLGKDWERRGWLTKPQRDDNGHPIGRQVTSELMELAGLKYTPAPEAPTVRQESGNKVTGVTERYKGQNAGNKAGNTAVTGTTEPTEQGTPVTPVESPHYCPVTACRWNTDGRGACDYAQRGLRCGDPQWRDEWRERMEEINGKD
jgi:hypothetical protein